MQLRQRSSSLIDAFALFLLCLGLTQMIGYLLNVPALKGIGFASAAAPFPKVFSDVDGLETFASEFTLILGGGAGGEIPITPELYSRLAGPYNRRNVYGAALSYAPRLKEEIWQMVFCYAFHNPGSLREELGIPSGAERIAVKIRTRTRGRADEWLLEARCAARS